MVAFMSVYLLFLGLSEMRVSWVTSGIMIGVILFQVPVAWLADRLGRIRVLLGCYGATIAGLCFLYSCRDSIWLTAALFLVGACSGAFYPLGLAILGEKTPASQLARASAWYLGINCCGSLIGPIVTGFAMERYGKASMFTAGAAAVLWCAGCLGRSRDRRLAAEVDSVRRPRLSKDEHPGGPRGRLSIMKTLRSLGLRLSRVWFPCRCQSDIFPSFKTGTAMRAELAATSITYS